MYLKVGVVKQQIKSKPNVNYVGKISSFLILGKEALLNLSPHAVGKMHSERDIKIKTFFNLQIRRKLLTVICRI